MANLLTSNPGTVMLIQVHLENWPLNDTTGIFNDLYNVIVCYVCHVDTFVMTRCLCDFLVFEFVN